MRIINTTQGSDEWLKARLGMITGTRLKSVMAGAQAQETLIYELVAEQLSGTQEKVWVNDAMQWGTDHEDEAVQLFEKKRKKKSEAVGFCISDDYPFLGLSPDRLTKTGDKYTKAIEVKCPATKTALKYRYAGGIPKEYKWQVVNYFLVCTDLKSLDFVVYDPRIINDDLKLFVVSVTRKDMQKDIDAAIERIHSFRQKWQEVYDKVRV